MSTLKTNNAGKKTTGKPKAATQAKPKAGKGGGGGPTAGGGYNYQAAVTSIALAFAARGAPLGWLAGLAHDVPVSVASETGSGGDDIRLVLAGGEVVDVQVKRGLTKGASLWGALIDLAKVLDAGAAQFGVLVVDGSSSGTIREDLSKDIHLLAQGAKVKAASPGADLATRLRSAGLDPKTVCGRLRIETVSATTDASGDIRAAKAQLGALCIDPDDAGAAFNALYRDAHAMQASRWMRNRPAIARVLRSENIILRDDPSASPTALLERLCRWTLETNSQFSILGVPRPLSIEDAFIPIIPFVREADEAEADKASNLAAAVARYQDWNTRRPGRDAPTSDPRALGRFYRRAVVVAGPGAGKSTLLSRVAAAYAVDGFAVLKVSALAIARRMSAGDGFEEALFDLALDGSGITPSQAKVAGVDDWVILIDGLDEAGSGQSDLIEGIVRFEKGHPTARMVLTTRPVGYHGARLDSWRHYELPSLAEDEVNRRLSSLLAYILPETDHRRSHLDELIKRATDKTNAGKAALRTPLMLGLAAALFASGGSLEGSRTAFYRGVLELVDGTPSPKAPSPPPGRTVRNRYLDALGWILISRPEILAEDASAFVASLFADELSTTTLKAEQQAEDCQTYWQALGVIEELRHADDRALAFVHKTFGEYAAGRFLAKASLEDQYAALDASTEDAGLREVIAFAAGLGLAKVMLTRLSDAGFEEDAGEERLLQALDILLDTRPAVPTVDAEPILDAAFKAIRDDRRGPASAVGSRLHQLTASFPALLSPRACALVDHAQPWTRLIALAVCMATDPDIYSLDEWIEVLIEISGADPNPPNQYVRAFSTSDDSVDLLQTFAAALAERILAAYSPDHASDIFERAFVGHDLQRFGFLVHMESLIQGLDIRPWWQKDDTSRPVVQFDIAGMARTAHATFRAISRGLQIGATPSGSTADTSKRPLYALSALLEAIDFKGTSLPEIWPLKTFGEAEDVRWLWRSVARLANISEEDLTQDAMAFEAYLADYDGESLSAVFVRTLSVDLPEPNWSASPTLPPDARLLETALGRPSSMVIVPAYEIAASAGPDLVRNLATRLLSNGKGLSLWAGAALSVRLPTAEALDLLFAHICGRLRNGSDHVIRQLSSVAPVDDPRRTKALTSALRQPLARSALAAAEWAVAQPRAQDLPILKTAYDYWRKDDARDRGDSFTRPPSPTPVLLKAMLALSQEPWRRLVKLYGDPRSDLRAVVADAFARHVAAARDLDEITHSAGVGELPLGLTEKVLERLHDLTEAQWVSMTPMLQSDDPKIRLAGMALLESAHIAPERRTALLKTLRQDGSNSVRERAARMTRPVATGLPALA